MLHHQVDQIVRSVPVILGRKFFKDGWGNVDQFKLLDVRRTEDHPLKARIKDQIPTIQWEPTHVQTQGCIVKRGTFESPFKDLLPKQSETVTFDLVEPIRRSSRTPVAVILAPTGDHGFKRRFRMSSVPLSKHGIASILIENPFYGSRKPPEQYRSYLRQVSDLMAMGAALIGETNVLIEWMKRDGSYGPFVLSGISMGGLMSCYSASLSDHHVGIVPCLSPTSALPLFYDGKLFGVSVADWNALKNSTPNGAINDRLNELLPQTDLENWPKPRVTEACVWVGGAHDAFIKPDDVKRLHSLWKDAELRWLNAGHVSGQLLYASEFVTAIRDSITRLKALGL